MTTINTEIRYTPLQAKMIFDLSDVDEILWGGAAGGGKSEGLLLYSLNRRLNCPGSTGLMLRRTFPELEKSLIRKSHQYFAPFARYKDQARQWVFPSGSVQEFGYCANESDVYQYQSAEYEDICFDEMSHFSEFQVLYMMSRLRSQTGKYRTQLRGASNPGNIGHNFLKFRYVDAARDTIATEDIPEVGVKTRYFIPAGLNTNTLMSGQAKAEYRAWLRNLPERERKQLEEGDWDYIPGAAFSEIDRSIHMINTDNIPDRLSHVFDTDTMSPRDPRNCYRSLDWGYAKPFSVQWYCCDYDGRIYLYRELYGCKGANEGIQMPARDLAIKIKEIENERGEEPSLCIADASIWDKPGNQLEKSEKLPSIAEIMAEEGIYWDRQASVRAKASRLQGKHQIHERLRIDTDGLPHLFVFNSCVHWWRTVPVMPLDKLNPEDVDSDSEDHAYDSTRYILSARPMSAIKPKPEDKPLTIAWINKHCLRAING